MPGWVAFDHLTETLGLRTTSFRALVPIFGYGLNILCLIRDRYPDRIYLCISNPLRVEFEIYVTAGGEPLFPQDIDSELEVLPPEAFRGPSEDSSVLVQLIVRHLLLVDCSDLFYVCWVEIRELCDGSDL